MNTEKTNNIREQDKRTAALIGEEALLKLKKSSIAIFGVGGVGGHCAEALVRAGVGNITLFDADRISISNINRQIIATHSTVGELKCRVMKQRILDINPDCKVRYENIFVTPELLGKLELSQYDYIIDAVDTVDTKVALAVICERDGIPLISSMGTGNKLRPELLSISDIYKTEVCPLARAMRSKLRRVGVKHLTVAFSREEPITPKTVCEDTKTDGRASPASISFVPSAAGLLIASYVVRDIIREA